MRNQLVSVIYGIACLAITRAAGAEAIDPLRLDRTVVEPLAEWVMLTLDPAEDDFSGSVRIDLWVHGETSSFRLHAEDLELGTFTLTRPGSEGAMTLTAETGELGVTTLTAPSKVAPGFHRLEVAFLARYRRDGVELYFGVPCPYAKLDQIAVPELTFGAMENARLITYRDTTILADPANTSFGQRRRRAEIVAHEMAHLRFGDLVTME